MKEKRYIEANALLEDLNSLSITITGLRFGKTILSRLMDEYKNSVMRIVDEQPTDDVVEVVRCIDCLYNKTGSCIFAECNNEDFNPNFYCADGYREEQ